VVKVKVKVILCHVKGGLGSKVPDIHNIGDIKVSGELHCQAALPSEKWSLVDVGWEFV
jgi:hypothetical protein